MILTVGVLGNVEPDRVNGRPNTSSVTTLIKDLQTCQKQFLELNPPPVLCPTGAKWSDVAAAVLVAGQSSEPTEFAKVHKDYAWDIMVEFELEYPTDDERDAGAINLLRGLYKDNPYTVWKMLEQFADGVSA